MKIEVDGKKALKAAAWTALAATWVYCRCTRTGEDCWNKAQIDKAAPVCWAAGAIAGALVYLAFGHEAGAWLMGCLVSLLAFCVVPKEPVPLSTLEYDALEAAQQEKDYRAEARAASLAASGVRVIRHKVSTAPKKPRKQRLRHAPIA